MVEPEDRTRFERSWHDPNPPALVMRWRRRDGRLVCVLVVEDDDAVRAVVQRILAKAG
jgi:hypothetical protein